MHLKPQQQPKSIPATKEVLFFQLQQRSKISCTSTCRHWVVSLSCRYRLTYDPCLAFSAQISAIRRDSSALCSNCSRLISSLTSEAAIELPVLSIRFCSDSIFDNVLSRKGAENLTPPPFWSGSRISSLRGPLLGPFD